MQAEILRRSQELQAANRALRAADDAKNDFLSRVSHELRTPLNAILGFSELLTLSEIDEGHRERAGLIHTAGRHLLALLDDVLDITRIEGGNLALNLVPVPVGALVTEVLDLVRPIADAEVVGLTPAPELPADWCVLADRQRLRQVLMNLLSNAIKFNHPTGTVTVTARMEPGERLRIDLPSGACATTGPEHSPGPASHCRPATPTRPGCSTSRTWRTTSGWSRASWCTGRR
ncbi:histidine kinase dimerization/phospho-acceptor domain-containing protein [Actinoplanes sp. NPDC026619]|uniref:sensor histidine kinase n=1 Tax=Actinoplanes sp. NPDC026619 TaxID=3155798 RepID=UPI0033E22801